MNNTMSNPDQSKQDNTGNRSEQMNWADMRTKVKNKWSLLSDKQLEDLQTNFDRLPDQIQKTYGYPRQQAEREFNEFKTATMGGGGMYESARGKEGYAGQSSGRGQTQEQNRGTNSAERSKSQKGKDAQSKPSQMGPV